MTEDEAKGCWSLLSKKEGEADPRSWGEQFVDLGRVLRNGTPTEQAERLHLLYRSKGPLPSSQQLMVAKYEDALFPLLENALGKSAKSMRQALHRGQPAFGKVEAASAQPPVDVAPYVPPSKPAEPALKARPLGTLPEMLAALRAEISDDDRAKTLDMLSEWFGRPWNSVVELGRPALEVIWAWYEPIAKPPDWDVRRGRDNAGLDFRCGRHFLWTLGHFADHPAAALLAVEGYFAIGKDLRYCQQYLEALPPALHHGFRAAASLRLQTDSPKHPLPLTRWLAG